MPVRKKKKVAGKTCVSDIEGFEPLLEDLPELYTDLRIERTDRADIIVRQVLEFCAGFYSPVRLTAFFVIYVIAHGTEIAGGPPFVKAPLPDPAFSLHTADRADIVFRKVIECRAFRDAIVRFPAERRVDVTAEFAAVPGHIL